METCCVCIGGSHIKQTSMLASHSIIDPLLRCLLQWFIDTNISLDSCFRWNHSQFVHVATLLFTQLLGTCHDLNMRKLWMMFILVCVCVIVCFAFVSRMGQIYIQSTTLVCVLWIFFAATLSIATTICVWWCCKFWKENIDRGVVLCGVVWCLFSFETCHVMKENRLDRVDRYLDLF